MVLNAVKISLCQIIQGVSKKSNRNKQTNVKNIQDGFFSRGIDS